jgi:hypothetical protein
MCDSKEVQAPAHESGFFLGWWLVYRSPNEVVTIHKTGMKAGMKMKCKQKNLVSMRVATHNFLFSS